MNAPFLEAEAVIIAGQAALVGLPGRGIPRWLERFTGRGWALILPLSIVVVIVAITLVPQVANALTWISLILIPPGAFLALGWAIRGTRWWVAVFTFPLLFLTLSGVGSLAGDGAAAILTALSAITVGRLLAGAVPAIWLKLGIVAMAISDAILVFGNQLQAPNAVLNAAIPAPGLPQLQYLDVHYASLGYGDVFVAGVLGGVLAAEYRRQWPVALLVAALSALWDLLFFHFNTLPATVPPAVALLLVEAHARLSARSLATRR